ncbi:2-dehydropantoate 2-reductase [Allohahella marinimesophila]|uniref:2-dehydropantoate 2-reductase n=1 Tax=Allohahella marinimesophila TaxID=1054972 RepID=A0ABP7P4U1_9GAMM
MKPNLPVPDPTVSHCFVIVGLGAIGTLFAAHLSQSHDCCALMLSSGSGSDRNANPGIASRRLIQRDSAILLEMPIFRTLNELTRSLKPCGRRHYWVLLTCKAPVAKRLLPSLLAQLRTLILEDETCEATLVIMQNGLQTHTLAKTSFANVFPKTARARVSLLAASTTEAARREGSEHTTVHHSATGDTAIGHLDESRPPATATDAGGLSGLLNACGLNARPVGTIEGILWNKLALNAIVNPLTALLRCTNGELPVQSDYRRLAPRLASEVLGAWQHWAGQVDAGSTAALPDSVAALLERVEEICERTAANRSSMLQDVLAGRSTEIDAINGYIIEYCEHHALPCEANRELVSEVRALTECLINTSN